MDVRECTKEWKKLKDSGGGERDHNKEWRPRSEFLSAGTAYKMLGHDHKVTHNAPRTSINAGSDIGHLVGSTKIHGRSLNQALTKIYGPAEVAGSLTVCCQTEAVHKVVQLVCGPLLLVLLVSRPAVQRCEVLTYKEVK